MGLKKHPRKSFLPLFFFPFESDLFALLWESGEGGWAKSRSTLEIRKTYLAANAPILDLFFCIPKKDEFDSSSMKERTSCIPNLQRSHKKTSCPKKLLFWALSFPSFFLLTLYAIKCGLLLLPLPRNNSGQAAAFFPPPLWPPPYLGVRSIPPPPPPPPLPPPREPKSEGTGREGRGGRAMIPDYNSQDATVCLMPQSKTAVSRFFWRHFLRGKRACLFLVSFFPVIAPVGAL